MTFSRTSYSPIRRIDSNKRLLIITIACSALIDAVSARLQFQFLGQCANIKLPYMYIHTIEPTTNLTNPAARNLSLRIIKIINCARYCLANSGETYRLVGGTRTCVCTRCDFKCWWVAPSFRLTPMHPFRWVVCVPSANPSRRQITSFLPRKEFPITISVGKLTDRLFCCFYKRNWNIFRPIPLRTLY